MYPIDINMWCFHYHFGKKDSVLFQSVSGVFSRRVSALKMKGSLCFVFISTSSFVALNSWSDVCNISTLLNLHFLCD